MLPENVRREIQVLFGRIEGNPQRLHGGDINDVWHLTTSRGEIVVKTRNISLAGMYRAEAAGLQALSRPGCFRIPDVLHVSEAFLALEYIAPGPGQSVHGEKLGEALACLHHNTATFFGWDHDNFIGSLPQSNTTHPTSVSFYREERLLPQFRLALQNGFTFRHLEHFLQRLEDIIPEEPASLVHGDLWSGNYMVSAKGEPCLIDPATCYASREMDLAMMALFGGFPKNCTEAYQQAYPLQSQWKERVPLWQLYYVLAHLNLFGAGYYSRCIQIMKTYL